jgi:hypothetical protein
MVDALNLPALLDVSHMETLDTLVGAQEDTGSKVLQKVLHKITNHL